MAKKKGKYEIMFGPIPGRAKPKSILERVRNRFRRVLKRCGSKYIPFYRSEEDLIADKFFAMEASDFSGAATFELLTKEEIHALEQDGYFTYPPIAREKGWDHFVSINRRVNESENGPAHCRTYRYGDVRVLKEFIPIEDGHNNDMKSLF